MKNKGFTLVELLAVIVIIGLILAITIPSSFKISSKVKTKAYKTKIEQIEYGAGETYGNTNIGAVRTSSGRCAFKFDGDDNLIQAYYGANGTISDAANLEKYPCIRMTIQDLVDAGTLDYDHKKMCDEYNCPTDTQTKGYYENVIINPTDDYIINTCNVYIYFKNNRTYATFDKVTCDQRRDNPDNGHEYKKPSKKVVSTTRR